jgi:hypothetical protein
MNDVNKKEREREREVKGIDRDYGFTNVSCRRSLSPI